MRSFAAVFALIAAAMAQQQIPGQRGSVIVSAHDETTLENTPIGCLTTTGKVTGSFTSCARFNLTQPASGNVYDGATINAGVGMCGWNLKDHSGPLMCGPGATTLGFYVRLT